ncbi:GntP family permease [Brachybacterium alimentarium]|uniref:GntP family permease n=1 Tax=Brachybacterium alimentarium TaxID=47845 RepID=UPI000BB78488|nr:GntP family permease [Brachybacterium alimentarium]PCC30812.1 permease [Brachybacterium alimentarium]
MSPTALLLIGAGSIAVLLFLIIYLKLNATISLIVVSAGTALAAGTQMSGLLDLLIDSFSGTVGKLAIIIGFGAIFGRLLEQSGGAEVLAETMLRVFGKKRAPLALSVASLLFGFPIFFDAGLLVMFPIIFNVARRLNGPVLLYALPAAGAFQVMHGLMPPHPGPVAAASVAGVNLGMVFLMGAVVAIPVWYLAGYRFALFMARRFNIEVPTILGTQDPSERELPGKAPSFGAVIGLLLLPIVLIAGNTITSTLQSSGVIAESALWAQIVRFLGETPIALVIAVLASLLVLGYARRVPWDNLTRIVDKGFMPVASIIMVAGAGGMFGGVLRETGIGDALATVLDSAGLPLIASAYLISVALRVAQGSATVAITTTAGLLGPAMIASAASPAQLGLVIVAMGAGSFFASHVNDSGFWLVGGLLQLDTATNLRLWTVFTSVISLMAFAVAALLYVVV